MEFVSGTVWSPLHHHPTRVASIAILTNKDEDSTLCFLTFEDRKLDIETESAYSRKEAFDKLLSIFSFADVGDELVYSSGPDDVKDHGVGHLRLERSQMLVKHFFMEDGVDVDRNTRAGRALILARHLIRATASPVGMNHAAHLHSRVAALALGWDSDSIKSDSTVHNLAIRCPERIFADDSPVVKLTLRRGEDEWGLMEGVVSYNGEVPPGVRRRGRLGLRNSVVLLRMMNRTFYDLRRWTIIATSVQSGAHLATVGLYRLNVLGLCVSLGWRDNVILNLALHSDVPEALPIFRSGDILMASGVNDVEDRGRYIQLNIFFSEVPKKRRGSLFVYRPRRGLPTVGTTFPPGGNGLTIKSTPWSAGTYKASPKMSAALFSLEMSIAKDKKFPLIAPLKPPEYMSQSLLDYVQMPYPFHPETAGSNSRVLPLVFQCQPQGSGWHEAEFNFRTQYEISSLVSYAKTLGEKRSSYAGDISEMFLALVADEIGSVLGGELLEKLWENDLLTEQLERFRSYRIRGDRPAMGDDVIRDIYTRRDVDGLLTCANERDGLSPIFISLTDIIKHICSTVATKDLLKLSIFDTESPSWSAPVLIKLLGCLLKYGEGQNKLGSLVDKQISDLPPERLAKWLLMEGEFKRVPGAHSVMLSGENVTSPSAVQQFQKVFEGFGTVLTDACGEAPTWLVKGLSSESSKHLFRDSVTRVPRRLTILGDEVPIMETVDMGLSADPQSRMLRCPRVTLTPFIALVGSPVAVPCPVLVTDAFAQEMRSSGSECGITRLRDVIPKSRTSPAIYLA